MRRAWVWSLSAIFGLACSNAMACRIVGYTWPTSTELATTSELVFVAHIESVRPLISSHQSLSPREASDMEIGLSSFGSTTPAEFSLLRSLKGPVPASTVLRSYMDNCSGIPLEAGADYLIFASGSEADGGDIAPIKGSFKLDGTTNAQTEFHKIEALLTTQATANP